MSLLMFLLMLCILLNLLEKFEKYLKSKGGELKLNNSLINGIISFLRNNYVKKCNKRILIFYFIILPIIILITFGVLFLIVYFNSDLGEELSMISILSILLGYVYLAEKPEILYMPAVCISLFHYFQWKKGQRTNKITDHDAGIERF